MRAYLIFVVAMLVGAFLLDARLMNRYKPPVELLQQTTLVSGRVGYLQKSRGVRYAVVNGIPFMCRMNFIGAAEECPERVANLLVGTEVTVAFANVPAALDSVPMAMSIVVHDIQVYTMTPEQVIEEYVRSSRRNLIVGPFVVLLFLFLLPCFFSAGFRGELLSHFS